MMKRHESEAGSPLKTSQELKDSDKRARLHKKGGVFLTIVVVGIVFIGLETFQRVKDYMEERAESQNPYSISFETWNGFKFRHEDGAIDLVHHPHLLYSFKQGQRTPEVTINAQGFRGQDWVKKESSSCRILVLGGSAAFGQGASSDEKVFTRLLEHLLNDDDPHRSEVYNAGVIGYSSKQELILLATELLDYQPDVVMIFDGWNDFYFAGLRPTGVVNAFSPTFYSFDDILSQHTQRWANVFRVSAIFRWAEQKIKTAIDASGSLRRFNHYSDNLAVYLPDYRENLTRMVRLSRAHGSDVIIVPQPELFHRQGTIPEAELKLRIKFDRKTQKGYAAYAQTQYPAFIEAASEVATSEGVPFVNSTTAFDEFHDIAFMDFVHFTDEGNEVLAQYLLPAVSKALNERRAGQGCEPRPTHS